MAKEKIPTEVESEVKSELKTPVDYLRAIRNTRILDNTNDAFWKHIGYGYKDFNSMNPEKARSKLRDLSDEFKKASNGECELGKMMDDYKTVSKYWKKSLSRSYSFDIHNYEEDKNKAKKERIFDILDYIYAPEEEKEKLLENISSTKTKNIIGEIKKICEKCNEYAVPILLLLTIKILPSFDNNKGDVKDIDSDYDKLFEFLEEYVERPGKVSCSTYFKTNVNKIRKHAETFIAYGNHDSGDSTILDRRGLIFYTQRFLTLANNNYWSSLQKKIEINAFSPELGGIWIESDQGSTDFWDIKELKNGYDFCYYCYNSKANVLIRTKYWVFLEEDTDCYVIFIYHPLMMKAFIQDKIFAEDLIEMTLIKLEKIKTKSWNEENPIDVTKISFEEELIENRWFKVKNLYKVKDDHYYQELIKNCNCINEYEKESYEFMPCLVAITRDFLYFELDDEIMKLISKEQNGNRAFFLQVPKSLDIVFDSITFGSNIGLLFGDGRVYLAVDRWLLYKEITTKEMRDKLKIEIVNSIDKEFYNKEADS